MINYAGSVLLTLNFWNSQRRCSSKQHRNSQVLCNRGTFLFIVMVHFIAVVIKDLALLTIWWIFTDHELWLNYHYLLFSRGVDVEIYFCYHTFLFPATLCMTDSLKFNLMNITFQCHNWIKKWEWWKGWSACNFHSQYFLVVVACSSHSNIARCVTITFREEKGEEKGVVKGDNIISFNLSFSPKQDKRAWGTG